MAKVKLMLNALASRHGTPKPEATCSTPGSATDATLYVAIELTTCSGVRPYDITGKFTARTWAVSNWGLRLFEHQQSSISAPAPASNRKEAVICVTANTLSRRPLPPVTRTPLLVSAEALRRVGRGQSGNKCQENGSDQRERSANPDQAEIEGQADRAHGET